MSQKRQDVSLPALVAASLPFTVLKDDGTAVNLAPYTFLSWQIAPGPGAQPAATKTLAGGIAINDGPNGKMTVSLAPGDITDSGLYWHVLNGQIGGGPLTRLFEGRAVISASPQA